MAGKSVIVVGAGISGLSTAYFLDRAGSDVTLLELEAVSGGTMQTVREDGWLVETGPTSSLETTPLLREMVKELGIGDEWVYADASADKRYILRGGKLHPLPMTPLAFLVSSLWGGRAKLRLLGEPIVGRAPAEESIAQFVTRRLGKEFLDYAIDPFVSGVYAGDPARLSVRAAFPKLYALEEKYGGLMKGMILGAGERRQRAEKAKDKARMFSFRGGMQTFPRAIARRLGAKIRYGCDVVAVERGADGRFRILLGRGGGGIPAESDVVVLAVPAYAAELLIRHFSPAASDALRRISYPPVAEVFLGYRAEDMGRALDGFGYLVPAKEGRSILGTIWSSSLFPGRAPEGRVALTTFVGGSRQPQIARKNEEDLIRLVTSELRALMNVRGDPVYARVSRWERAIPQYNLGHQELMTTVDGLETDMPGLFFCSNFRGGIAVGDCVMNGEKTARRILETLR
jgi:oxygen-dependent protoporphyrinogen oxidase